MAQDIKQFFNTAIIDCNPSISSAAHVSAYHLHPHAKVMIKTKAQEAINAKSSLSFFMASASGGILGLGRTWLCHKSDMVIFEAAHAICEIKNVTAAQLNAGKSLFYFMISQCSKFIR